MVCSTGPGPVTVTGVRLVDATGGLRVDAFAVRPNPMSTGGEGFGDARLPLDQIGGGFDPDGVQVVPGLCSLAEPTPTPSADPRGVPSELAVQVSKPGSVDASATGLAVEYTSDGETGELRLPWALTLCEGAAGSCSPPEPASAAAG